MTTLFGSFASARKGIIARGLAWNGQGADLLASKMILRGLQTLLLVLSISPAFRLPARESSSATKTIATAAGFLRTRFAYLESAALDP